MRKPTIYEIKRATIKTAPSFFCKENMRGSKQTMKSFTVAKSPKGNIYIYAPQCDGYTFRQFIGDKLYFPGDMRFDTLTKVLAYIENN